MAKSPPSKPAKVPQPSPSSAGVVAAKSRAATKLALNSMKSKKSK